MARSLTTENPGPIERDPHRHSWGDRVMLPHRRALASDTPPAPAAPRTEQAAEQPARTTRRSSTPQAAFIAFSLLVGAGYGCLERLQGGDWPATAAVIGIASVTSLIALHVLQLVMHIVTQAMKVVVPAAILLAVGYFLDWEWAVEATSVLKGLWLESVDQIQAFWTRSV